MFILTNTDLPELTTTYHNSCINSILKPSTSLTNSGLISNLFNKSTTIITPVIEGETSGTYEVIVDTLPDLIITSTRIYTLAKDVNNPVDGEFIYVDGKVIIYSNLNLTNITLVSTPLVNSLRIPTINGLVGLPVLSNITISESFQDHPTASISLVTSVNYIAQVRSLFRVSSLFNLSKYQFVVNSYNEELSNNDDILRVNINLRGKWDNYVNYPIALNNTTDTNNNFQDPECSIDATELAKTKKYVTINEVAAKAGGARITGIEGTVIVDKSDSNATVTLGSLINEYLDINSAFVDYNRPDVIVCKKLNAVTSWTYYSFNILSNFNTTINRNLPLPINGSYGVISNNIAYTSLVPTTITNRVPSLTAENTSIIPRPTIYNYTTPDNFNDNGDLIIEEATKDIPPEFEVRKPVKRTYIKGDLDAATCPSNITRLRTLDLNHDKSGVTKTIINVTEEDNNPITEVTRRYGFAYTAWDITLISGGSIELDSAADPWWFLIEKTTTDYIYDEKTGYLLGYNLSGEKLIRAQIEGSDNFTQNYALAVYDDETPSVVDTATYNTYLFRYVPVYGAKRYQLAQHRDYYQQFGQSDKFIKRCNKDGSSSYMKDPNYVEPMFVIAESEEYSCFLQVSNPLNLERESGDPIQPPLTSGQETYNRTTLKILPSKNSNREQFGSEFNSAFQGEDTYISYTSNFTSQDPGFRAVTEETSSSTNTGIPPVHTRKPPKYELIEPKKENPKKPSNYRYVFWTEPYKGGYPRTGSYSFDKAKNINEVTAAVNNQLRIDDIRNTLTSTMTVPYNGSITTGDKVTVIFNGLQCRRRVVSITHSIIQEFTNVGIETTAVTNLTMGIDRNINVSSKKEKIVKPIASPNPQILVDVINVGFTLGSLLPNTLGRGS
jgi:hypothetical protein